jgi:hypothetical protein
MTSKKVITSIGDSWINVILHEADRASWMPVKKPEDADETRAEASSPTPVDDKSGADSPATRTAGHRTARPGVWRSETCAGAWLIGELLDEYGRFCGHDFVVLTEFSFTPQETRATDDKRRVRRGRAPQETGNVSPVPLTNEGRYQASNAIRSYFDVKAFDPKETEHTIANTRSIYRISRFIGYQHPDPAKSASAALADLKAAERIMPDEIRDRRLAGAPAALTLINIDDVSDDGLSGRRRAQWTAIFNSIDQLAQGRHCAILKTNWPIDHATLGDIFKLKERLIVVLNADDLRKDIKISYGLSWDSTAADVVRAIKRRVFSQLKDCHIIIRFGLDGAIHCLGQRATFYYDPGVAEGGYARTFKDGTMAGFSSVFCASLAIDFDGSFEAIGAAIGPALVAARRLLEFGYKISERKISIDHYEVFDRSDELSRRFAKTDIRTDSYDLHTTWGFLNTIVGDQLTHLARDIVVNGNIPSDRYGVPLARFGKLETLDRSEIESYRSIQNLLAEFLTTSLASKKSERPLSIGVFGQPGTGKSFGVLEVAKSLQSDALELDLVFNVAQFTSVDDLTSAFHIVRDAGLKGKVPLAFFDEFDAVFENQQLAWLKYFLAPMQDGSFKDGESMHPIGKAILVFAGGRSHSFDKFRDQFKADADLPDSRGYANRDRELDTKLPDFISRLRGYVNIIGPNPKDGQHPDETTDPHYIVRRAMLLRSLLVRKCDPLLNRGVMGIDDNVLDAFLRVPSFRHGVRSIEALIDMSILSGKTRFDKSALPPRSQMDMHVEATQFMTLIDR